MQSVRIRRRPREYEAVMFTSDRATELRNDGWIDEVDNGLGREGEGPYLRGHIVIGPGKTNLIVYPGDAILRDAETGQRTAVQPGWLEKEYEFVDPEAGGFATKEDVGGDTAVTTPDPTAGVGEGEGVPSDEGAVPEHVPEVVSAGAEEPAGDDGSADEPLRNVGMLGADDPILPEVTAVGVDDLGGISDGNDYVDDEGDFDGSEEIDAAVADLDEEEEDEDDLADDDT